MTTQSGEPAAAWKKHLLEVAALALAVLFAGKHLANLPARFRYPGDLNFIEGISLAEMIHLRQGVPIYAPPSAQRYEVANYGPLYYLLGMRVVDPQYPAFLPLRLLALAGTLGCALGAGILAYRVGRCYLAAVVAPGVFLGSDFVLRHGDSARCDSVALSLSFAAFLVAHRFRNGRKLLWAAPLMLAGLFYKHQFIAGPLAVALYLWFERRRRLALEFCGLMALGWIALSMFFHFVVFSGQAFLEHFILFNLLPFDQADFLSGLGFFAITFVVPLLVAVESLRAFRDRLLAYYLGCAVSLSLLSVARTGSDTNYFLESYLLLSCLFAALLAKQLADISRAAELVVLLAVTMVAGQLFRSSVPTKDDVRADRAVQEYLGQHFPAGAPALSYYAGDVLRAGLALPISDLYLYNQLILKGTIDECDLKGLVERRRYAVILLGFDLPREDDPYIRNRYLTPLVQQSILANYELSATLEMPRPEKLRSEDRFYVWVPRPPSDTPAAEGHRLR